MKMARAALSSRGRLAGLCWVTVCQGPSLGVLMDFGPESDSKHGGTNSASGTAAEPRQETAPWKSATLTGNHTLFQSYQDKLGRVTASEKPDESILYYPLPRYYQKDCDSNETTQRVQDLMTQESLNDCNFEIVMIDSRKPLLNESVYGSKTFVLNYAYAKRHGYNFTFVHCVNVPQGFGHTWPKIFYLAERLGPRYASEGCSWLMYLDSDAFFHQPNRSLVSFLEDLGTRYAIPRDIGAVFVMEQSVPSAGMLTLDEVNTGVFLTKHGEHAHRLFQTVKELSYTNKFLKTEFPHEQGWMTEILFPNMMPKAKDQNGKSTHVALPNNTLLEEFKKNTAVVDMLEMNSPWGTFVEHIWGGVGSEKRSVDYDRALKDLKLTGPRYEAEFKEAEEHMVPHDCS